MKTDPPNMPKFGTDKGQDEGKKGGFLAALLAKLGLGGAGAGAGAFPAATVGVNNPMWAGILASKVGITALVIGVGTAAAGLGVAIYNNIGPIAPPSPEDVPGLVFENAQSQKTRDAAASPANPNGVSRSLDYLSQANQPSVNPSARLPNVQGASVPSASASSGRAVPDNSNGPSRTGGAVAARPAMVAGPSLSGSNSSVSNGSFAQMQPQNGLSSGIGGGFQKIYHPAAAQSSAGRSASGVTSRALLGAGGSKAMDQLGMTNRVVSSNLRSPMVSSQGSGLTYDGGARASLMSTPGGNIQGGGLGVAGSGVGAANSQGKPNPESASKQIQQVPQPGPGGNATPWQWAMNVALGAMALALIAFIAMGIFKNKAKTSVLSAHMWLKAAEWAAGIATAAAAVATVMGITMMTTYGQTMQGVIWTAIGGIFTGIAAYSWYNLATDRELHAHAAASDAAKPWADDIHGFLKDNPHANIDMANTTAEQADKGIFAVKGNVTNGGSYVTPGTGNTPQTVNLGLRG